MADSKRAEKEYLERTGSSAWERHKPFSPPGLDTIDESANLLHDFSVAMMSLRPSPDDLIIDLGAGGGWCSDLLARLNLSSIAVDLSLDMLRVGVSRSNVSVRAVAADMEALPFRTGSFQKAICLNAIHHVPNIERALVEIARILDDDGVAFFSEPGEEHSSALVSKVAMESYGVLEQDIVVGEFLTHCIAAGFVDVFVQPLSHVIPGFTLTVEQWDAWSRMARSQRPRRALEKMYLALLELFGIGKKRTLFEEALALSMVRTLREVIRHHPIVVARKAVTRSIEGTRWRAALAVTVEGGVTAREFLQVRVVAQNTGNATWKASSRTGIGHVALGIQLLDAEKHLLSRDYFRAPMPHDVAPNENVALSFEVPRPTEAGVYFLKVDLVAEGVTWFELAGSSAIVRRLDNP